MMPAIRRFLLVAVAGGGLVLFAVLAMGVPHWGAAWALVTGGYPTSDRVLDLLEMVVWIVVACVVVALVIWTVRVIERPRTGTHRRGLEAFAILLAGVIILLGGISRHDSLNAGPRGGSVGEVTTLGR
jgi:hypothetical protein